MCVCVCVFVEGAINVKCSLLEKTVFSLSNWLLHSFSSFSHTKSIT